MKEHPMTEKAVRRYALRIINELSQYGASYCDALKILREARKLAVVLIDPDADAYPVPDGVTHAAFAPDISKE